ncbi:hypothetical protein ACWGKW_37610 [Streptomyces sp. NPDC054766]
MSTERPDNDATDPVEGHAEGPVEGAVAGPAGDAVTGPAGDAADGSVGSPAEGTTDGTTAGSGEGSGERSPEGTIEGTVEGPGEAPAEGTADGPAGDEAEGRAEGPGPDSGSGTDADGGSAEGPGEDADAGSSTGTGEGVAQGVGAGSGEGDVESRVSGPGEASGEDPGESDATSPAAGPGQAAAAGSPLEDGVAGSPAADATEGTAEGHAKGSVVGSPSEGSLDEHADGSLGGPLSGIVGGPVEGAGAGGVRRRHTPAVVASVVAAVLLVGGGGAYFAATASGGGRSGTPGADGTPPRLALDGFAASTGATGGTAGIAPGEPNPYGATYRADGALPTGPGSAHVQWAEGTVTRAEVARLAKALDLAGTPRLVGDAWTVGTAGDGAEPNLRVNANAPGTWTFSSAIPGTDNCAKGKMCRPVGSGSPAGTGPGPVSEAAAEKAAVPVLKAAGQDDAKLDASQLMGGVRVVNADPVLGGLPTYGWTTGLQINGEGHVIGGSGQLKTPVEGDAYPVVGARKTLDLMNGSASATGDRRMGIGGCASPVPLKDRDEMPCEHPSAALKPASVTVEKATFGLAAYRANGRQALVPSWLFEVRSPGADDTYTVTHPAVDPEFLGSTASPASSAQPTTAPTAPPDEPSSPAATRDVDVQGYTAHGKDLTVVFTGGVCADYTASASESSGKVTVTVTEKPWKNRICIMIAKIYEKTVRLDEPLGDRTVVGTDGKAVHHGSSGIPETSGAMSPGAGR